MNHGTVNLNSRCVSFQCAVGRVACIIWERYFGYEIRQAQSPPATTLAKSESEEQKKIIDGAALDWTIVVQQLQLIMVSENQSSAIGHFSAVVVRDQLLGLTVTRAKRESLWWYLL